MNFVKTGGLVAIVAAAAELLYAPAARATNPLILDQFTADPTARVFEGKLYVYPSHDIPEPPGYSGRPNWFVMEDYHAFSSSNLTDWTDHGVILARKDVPWADQSAYAMWAPDAVMKDGRYYFYFPAMAKTGGFRVGVATSDKPEGPFKPLDEPIDGVKGIDPAVLFDKAGNAYLFYSLEKIFVAKLKPNLTEIEGEYNFNLEISPEDMQRGSGIALKSMAMMHTVGDGPSGGPDTANPAANVDTDGSGAIFKSVQDYGLKLDKRKAPIDIVVVDKIEKLPTEN